MYICVQKQRVSLSHNFMGKLQLYITIAYKGYREMLEINADDVKANVRDMSYLMGKIKYKPGRMSIFFMLKYTHEGVFITALRTIPVQKPDHLAAWVFIPYDIKISTTEIEDVIEAVVRAISNSKITADIYSELRKIFGKEYETIPYAPAIAPNFGTQTGYRYYGDVTPYILSDLIGSKRYQTSYLTYSEVVLADKSLVSDIEGQNLTDEPLDQMVKLSPPASPDPTLTPTIFECKFDKPYLAPLMGTVEISWMKGNTLVALQSVIVNRPNMRPDSLTVEELHPTATDTPDQPTDNHKSDTSNKSQHFFEEPAQPETTTHFFEEPAQPQTATPYNEAPAQSHNSRDENRDSNKSRFSSILGKKLELNKFRKPTPETSTKALWALIGFVAGVLMTLLGTCIHKSMGANEHTTSDQLSDTLNGYTPAETVDINTGTSTTNSTTTVKGPEQKTTEVDSSFEGAIAYLEGYKTWNKKELDKYPELAGLYEDMNNFRLKRLVDHWGPKLKKSARFSKIVTHAKQAIKRGKKPRVPEGQKTFNTSGKENIYIMTYLNTIDP